MLRALILEDSPQDVEIIRELLIDAGFDLDMDCIALEKEFVSLLRSNTYDVILADFKLPGFDGFGALRWAKEICPNVPFICVSGTVGEETAVELLKLGAVDYVLKDRPKRLSSAIKRALVEAKDKERQRQAEEELLKLKKAIDNSGEVIFLTDKEGIFTFTNPAFTSIYGFTADEIVGKVTPRILKSGVKDANYYKLFWETLKSGKEKRDELINKRKDGTLINVEISASPIFDEKNNIIGFLGIQRDITARKRAEEEIVMLAHSLRSVNECVSITDKEDNILFVNESFLKTYGYSEHELIGGKMSIVLPTVNIPELVSEIIPTTLNGKWAGELWNKRKDGSEFLIYLSTSIINDKEGKPLGLIGVASDITERKRAEKELIVANKELIFQNEEKEERAAELLIANKELAFQNEEKEKRAEELIIANTELAFQNEEKEKRAIELIAAKEKAEQSDKLKDAFINNMSHEIRTPLNGILGLSNLIKENYIQYIKTEDEELFTGIDFSAERIMRTVDMILNYSRLQTGEFAVITKEIDIFEICERIIKRNRRTAETKNLELILDNRCRETKIIGDEYTINEAVTNLVDNALKFTKKGFIKVTLSPGENDGVKLEIKDTGIGISDDYLEHLYEPYRQEIMGYGRPYEGLGLGLAITKRYFELNKAALTVESKKGEGTTFMVEFHKGKHLKINQPEKENVKSMDYIKPAETKKEKLIIVVEDDRYNRDVLKKMLEKEFKPLLADSAEEVYALLKDNKIDLILMDISIQGEKNGLELTTELKATKKYSQIPVIAVTAHAFNEDRQNALAAGCDDYLSKPFTKESLLEKIEKFVKGEIRL